MASEARSPPVIGGRRSLQGRKPGDKRVRVERPHAPYFRYTGKGTLTAKEAASAPTTPVGKAIASVRGLFFGRPLASEDELGERLSKTKALAIFSSDAISSSAYATEEILRVLILGGAAALAVGVEISIAISVLLVAVAISYRQICIAYPSGGGSYTVSRRNIGRTVSLIAASALMIDYVMTVAVSTSSAVEQVVSAFPALHDERVLIGVAAIGLIAIANLRGLREAGNIFAAPTYLFIVSALLMIGVGAFRIVVLGEGATYAPTIADQATGLIEPITLLLVFRAFAAGAVALTGTEAIATGVPAFKPPESRNAATTLAVMAALLATLFIGITFLAVNFAILPIEVPEKQTVIAQVARTVYGDGALFYLFQAFTALLLFLAANTSFNAFPRLLAILAGDGHMPRQFALRGDRLAFSYGIIILATLAAALIVYFEGSTHALIPLYAVGVFIDFTISQTGMIRHWLREKSPGYRRRLAINAFGAVLTGDRRGHRHLGEVLRRRVARPRPDPDPRGDHVVHLPPVRGAGARARGPRHGRAARSAPRAARRRPGQRDQPGGRPGPELRPGADARRPRRLRHRRPRCRRCPPRPLGAAAPRHPARHRRVAVPGGHLAVPRLPRHPRPGLAARQGGAGHDRRPARVRRPPLVGPLAV